MSAADPPNPIPDHLWSQRASLGPEDMRIAPSTAELRTIARVIEHDRLAGQALVTMRDGSPWLELDVFVPEGWEALDSDQVAGVANTGVWRYAIWRYTGKAYRCDEHGAVEDDPIEL